MTRLNLNQWALIAEVVSGIALIITLAFLAFEMNANTNAIRAQTYQTLMQQLNDFRIFVSDPEIVAANEKLITEGWDSLSAEEKQKVRQPVLINWGIYESAFFAYERNVLGDEEWVRFEVGICRRYRYPVHQDVWNAEGVTSMNELLTPKFVEYVIDRCQ